MHNSFITFHLFNENSSRSLILSANTNDKLNKIDWASHDSYKNLYSELKGDMCLFLIKKLASDSLFVEKINSLNTNEDEIIKNFLNEFSFEPPEENGNLKLGRII